MLALQIVALILLGIGMLVSMFMIVVADTEFKLLGIIFFVPQLIATITVSLSMA